MTEILGFLTSVAVREVTATGLIIIVVVMIFTGRLVPIATHVRELKREQKNGEDHRQASEKKDVAIARLLDQNSNLVAGVRIADKFYGDFVPPVDAKPRAGVADVGSP